MLLGFTCANAELLLNIVVLDIWFKKNVNLKFRFGSTVRHRVVEDKFMRQKAKFLIDEAASWSLLWYLFGKGASFEVVLLLQ